MAHTYNVPCNNNDTLFDSADNFKTVVQAIAWVEKHGGPEFSVNIDEVDGEKYIYCYHMSYRPRTKQWFIYYWDTWYALPHDKIEALFAADDYGWYLYKNCKPC